MSVQITTAFVNQFHSEVRILYQQVGARLRQYVSTKTVNAEFDTAERIGSVEASEIITRHGDTEYGEAPHSRRRYSLTPYRWADLIDKPDQVQTLIDPRNDYARIGAAALGRKTDRVIINAALGNAFSGKNGETTVALPAAQKIAWDGTEYGGAFSAQNVVDYGMTVAKLRAAKAKLDEAEAPEDGRVIVCSARQVQDLLAESEVTSVDTNTVRALVNGQVNTYLGFTFIRVNSALLPTFVDGTNDDTVRQCFAFQRDAMRLGIGMGADMQVRIDELPGKDYSVQVWVMMMLGATRIEDEGVVEIQCSESYNNEP